MQMEPGLELAGNLAARERAIFFLLSSTFFSPSAISLAFCLLFFLHILFLFHLSSAFSSSPLPLFLFAVAVVATLVSDSPQPAIAAALVLCAVIRMFIRELVSLSTSSSRRLLRLLLIFSPPLPPRRHVAFLVAVRTVRSFSIAWLAKTELFAEEMPFCGLFAVAL